MAEVLFHSSLFFTRETSIWQVSRVFCQVKVLALKAEETFLLLGSLTDKYYDNKASLAIHYCPGRSVHVYLDHWPFYRIRHKSGSCPKKVMQLTQFIILAAPLCAMKLKLLANAKKKRNSTSEMLFNCCFVKSKSLTAYKKRVGNFLYQNLGFSLKSFQLTSVDW